MSTTRTLSLNQSWMSKLLYRLRGRDPVAEYYAWLGQFGRVTEGRVIDVQLSESGDTTIYYRYDVANVDYETSEKLTNEQLGRRGLYVPGASVTVRFDPRNPGSSMVV